MYAHLPRPHSLARNSVPRERIEYENQAQVHSGGDLNRVVLDFDFSYNMVLNEPQALALASLVQIGVSRCRIWACDAVSTRRFVKVWTTFPRRVRLFVENSRPPRPLSAPCS